MRGRAVTKYHLAHLTRVRQILEMMQKDNRLAKRPSLLRRLPIAVLLRANQRTATDSALYPFVTLFFTRLP
jgi:hypothetical protein